MQRRAEFSFQGSPARGRLLPPRPPPPTGNNNPMAPPRYGVDDEEARWLQASLQASPDYNSSGGGSGTPSPQLWAHHPSHQHLLHRQYPASVGSSPSRAQAIAGYRRDMLDLVRGLPESAYELSLRDIVEHHHPSAPPSPPSLSSPPPPSSTAGRHASRAVPVPVPAQERLRDAEPVVVAAVTATADAEDGGVSRGKKKQQGRKQRTATMMRKQRSRRMERSVSLDTGLLIKLFLPLSVGGAKKKPDAAATKDDKKKKKQSKEEKKKQGKKKKETVAVPAPEEEWWTKSEFSEAGSSSRTSSTGSSNSSAASVRNVSGGAIPRAPARSWSRKRTGCYAFFRPNKGKNGVNQD